MNWPETVVLAIVGKLLWERARGHGQWQMETRDDISHAVSE